MSFFTQTHEDRWYAYKIGGTTTGAIQATSQQVQLGAGFYRAISTVNCYLKQGDSTVAATTSDCFVPANNEIFFQVDSSDDTLNTPGSLAARFAGPGLQGQPAGAQSDDRYLAFIRSTVDGTLYITRVSSLTDLAGSI